MYRENIDDLSEEELGALDQTEKVFAEIHGDGYSDHSENAQTLHSGVTGALKRDRQDEARRRLNDIVMRLEQQENESIVPSPLVSKTELQAICCKIPILLLMNDASTSIDLYHCFNIVKH